MTAVIGAKELMQKLKDLPRKANRVVLREGLTAGAEVILHAAQDEVPVRTGLMRSKLAVLTAKGKRGGVAKRVGFRKSAKLVTNSASGSRYFYPAAVEFGHGDVEGGHQIEHAFQRSESQALQVARERIGAGIEREAMQS